jgi:hypothetical protein
MPGFGPGENNFGPEGGGQPGGRRDRNRGSRGTDRPSGEQHAGGEQRPPPQVRMGPDGQPLPPRSKRPRRPIGPDANGLGPDGTPWDPERRAKRQAERQAKLNTHEAAPVEAQTPSAPAETQPESPTE